MNNRHILDRPLSNAGPMSPPQVRAMWAKRSNPASESDRPYIPVPRVPIPGYPRNPPPHNGASRSIEYGSKTDDPTPPETEFERVMRLIAEIRARPVDPNAAVQYISRFEAAGRQAMAPPSQTPPGKVVPKPGTKNGIWMGTEPDPALKKKYPRGGRINNRFAAVIGFLAQHAR